MSDLPLPSGQTSPIMRRSHSISSDRPSLTGFGGLLSPPTSISPDPAFIAASAASQIVTNDHDSQADVWFDQHGIEPSGETALVAAPALKLVNRFLDQLLFNFLSVSRSTSLTALRPAISDVLKPKLAKEAIGGADQELHEYLGGSEDEDLLALQNGQDPSSDWDLELVWKRTRLRCMVYSSLGDMEEEDEDYYTEQEHLDDPRSSSSRFSNGLGVVSPAVAIFLTSVLEFMGEQVLIVAGQAAYHRLRTKHEKEDQDETSVHADIAERVVVEEADMERVALDRTLGRLWRAWKKRIRSPTTSVSLVRSFSRESVRSSGQTPRAASVTAEHQIDEDDQMDEDKRRPSLATVLAEFEYAATVPLPITKDDVREIEIPGLVRNEDDQEEVILEEEDIRQAPRPKSWIAFPQNYDFAHDDFATGEASGNELPRPSQIMKRQRSSSVPRLMWTPFVWRPSTEPKPSFMEADSLVETATHNKDAQNSGERTLPEAVSTKNSQIPEAAANVSSEPNGLSKKAQTDPAEKSTGSSGIVAGVLGGAAAVGAAAVAGIVAAAKGEAPQTGLKASHDLDTEVPESGSKTPTDSELDEEFKEVRIMNAHRVSVGSVGGRKTPDDAKRGSTRSSNRSPSVHSVRVIDVTSPRSPTGSRHSSVGTADYAPLGRPLIMSPANGRHSPTIGDVSSPRIGSPVSRGPTSSPNTKPPSSHGLRQKQKSTSNSISDVSEKSSYRRDAVEANDPSSPLSQAAFAAALQGVDVNTFPPNDYAVNTPVSVTSEPREELVTSRSVGDQSSSATKVRILADRFNNGPKDPTPRTPTSPTTSFATYSPSRTHQVNGRHGPPSPQTKDIASRAPRSIHTSGSGSSSSTSHKLKPVRTSEESPTQVENKSQTFEQLIQSDQTIQYTLTPQNMRDIESPEPPRKGSIANSIDGRPATGRSHSSSVSKYVGIKPNLNPESPQTTKPVKSFKPVARPAANTGSRLRPNAPQPRDARVDRDSIGDFAEFIRSTGPSSASTFRSANGNAGMRSGGPLPPSRSDSNAGKARLQAREAVVPRGDNISDLIDFVRSGPQLEKEDHRIPRNVAPFRSTMDSEQMSGAAGGRAVDASLPEPRYSASVNGSVTSSSPLLNTSRNKSLPAQSKLEFDEEDRMPKRKTRRVRDPYAIDFSDEEEEYDAAGLSRPNVIEEESLADFLRNVPPPANSSPAPIYTNLPANKTLKKKVSSPGLMSRLGRSQANSPSAPQATSVPKTHTPIAAQFSTKQAPIQQGRSGNYASQVEGARKKIPQKSYQPREAVYASSRTNDLAEFLRSEPPSSMMQTQPQPFIPSIQKEESSAFQRLFGRKNVH